MGISPSRLSARIRAVVAIDPDASALEFGGRWWTWGELGTTVEQVATLVPSPGTQVGILLRNRPASVGLLLGVLRAGGCVVVINPGRGVERTREDVASLDLPFVAGEPADLARFVGPEARATRITTDDLGGPVAVEQGHSDGHSAEPTSTHDGHLVEPVLTDPHERRGRPGTAVRMLTSGTTGPPKRVDLSYDTLEQVLVGAKHYESDRGSGLRLRTGVAVVSSPLVHLGGLFRVLQCVSDGRSFALLERFTVDGWVDAVRRHRPATASLVPAALRMVLDADPDPDELRSLRSVVSGTAPLSADDADAFTARYDVPVLTSYAATEFGGGVAGWNVADHRRFWASKRGSVGRAHPGCELRVVEPDTSEVLGTDEEGLLEVKARQLGADAGWVRTTDLARIDADGFLWIVGRADQAILRGGFKVHPNQVAAALERHPAVRAAAVVGRADARLGAVPVAAVELRADSNGNGDAADVEQVTPERLLAHASSLLARYELPTEIHVVDELPRTPSGKVDLAAVDALLDPNHTADEGTEGPSEPAPIPRPIEQPSGARTQVTNEPAPVPRSIGRPSGARTEGSGRFDPDRTADGGVGG
jgi:acyl-CoA synthetase (AMP-forming)/AMP-acid ligase II